MTSALSGLYYEYHLPLVLWNLLEDVIGRNQTNPNAPHLPRPTANRMWFSQPRPGNNPLTEVITVNLKLPLSVSEIGFEALRTSCRIELWYCDRQNNWRQVLDESRIPITLRLSASQTQSWYKAHYYCYPLVAKKLQFRFTRIYDPITGTAPYCVGMRNGLIRRNIYTRHDGTQGIEPQQDPLGNTFTNYIKDWDAGKAFDNRPYTFWRSMPMPDPEAVCAMYLDVRDTSGAPQLVDALYVDPVHVGQNMNLYYSNDDTEGIKKLSPIAAVATTDENTTWQAGKGRWDASSSPGTSVYEFPFAWGPLVSEDCWIGIEWAPDFAADDGPPENPVLLQVTPPTTADGTQYAPTIFYDVGAAEIVLELSNGDTTYSWSAALSPLPSQYQPLRIVAGWSYGTQSTVYLNITTYDGTQVGTLTSHSTLPVRITLDGIMGCYDFRGLFTAHVVKLENFANSSAFQANPNVYVSPDPVVPDAQGSIPTTSLDNAIYAAAWAMQEHGTGGGHESRYEDKTWTPIWRNYFTQKGKLFFPQQINLKYLKVEFTNLTEEPYPIFDSGIKTTYRVFPLSVTQSAITRRPSLFGGLLSLGADVWMRSIGSVNWLNPGTVARAVNSMYGQTVTPITITSGAGYNTSTLPNTSSLDLYINTRKEVSTPWVYRRTPFSSWTLAAHHLNAAGSTTTSQGVTPATATASDSISQSFTPALSTSTPPATLPSQGKDWWVFPGATLRMPATIMTGMFGITETVCRRKATTETRLRFNTTCIHRYDLKTAIRDTAVAYFAGIREIQPLMSTYITELDPEVFSFSSYDSTQWVQNNIAALDSGPLTTAGALYDVINPGFDRPDTMGGLYWWDAISGEWIWETSTAHDHWYPGSATTVADGTEHVLRSSIVRVLPGAHIEASVWASWAGLTATSGSEAVALRAMFYANDGDDSYLSSQTVALTYTPWPEDTPLLDGNYWAQIVVSEELENEFTVPEGALVMHLALVVSADATAGQVWFDTVEIGTSDVTQATVYKSFTTTSTFSKLTCNFYDSGAIRSDDMWAREDPLAVNIPFTDLAYYTTTIPDVIPAGMWSDTFAGWADATITWGAPRALVAINVDPDRLYQGKRVLHFTRAGGAEEAGVKIRQFTNFVPNALFRIGCIFYKPVANDNQITVRLRRVSDGVYIHQETFDPVVGYWYEHLTGWVEIPDSVDQIYTVEFVCFGDEPDEMYLNDLYCEVANIRYFVRLGGAEEFLHDVTPLVYADPPATVSSTEPVNEFSVEAVVLSPRAFLYGCSIRPTYLR